MKNSVNRRKSGGSNSRKSRRSKSQIKDIDYITRLLNKQDSVRLTRREVSSLLIEIIQMIIDHSPKKYDATLNKLNRIATTRSQRGGSSNSGSGSEWSTVNGFEGGDEGYSTGKIVMTVTALITFFVLLRGFICGNGNDGDPPPAHDEENP